MWASPKGRAACLPTAPKLNWVAATNNRYWSAGAYAISAVPGASGSTEFRLARVRQEIGTFPSLEAAQNAAESDAWQDRFTRRVKRRLGRVMVRRRT